MTTIVDEKAGSLALPRSGRGRRSAEQQIAETAAVRAWCDSIIQIAGQLEFKVSARGWCYELEDHGLNKDDFDKAEALLNDCRKKGLLPLDIFREDQNRAAIGVETIDHETPAEFAEDWVYTLTKAHRSYRPISFWENQDHYVEMLVEKIDLRSLFEPVCARYSVPLGNMRGWCDINERAAIIRRIAAWQRK